MARRTLPVVNDKGELLCTMSTVAVQFGITNSAVSQWVTANQFELEDGKVNLSKYIQARFSEIQEEKKELSDTARKLKAEADLKTSKARQEEMITLQMMGELIPQEEVKDKLEMTFLDIRQKLLSLPEAVKSKVYSIDPTIATDCAGEVKNAVTDILERLATGDNTGDRKALGRKPKRNYKKRKTSVSTAATTDSE